MSLAYRPLTAQDDAAIAALIRGNLKANRLDIPGTAYYDEALDCLSPAPPITTKPLTA